MSGSAARTVVIRLAVQDDDVRKKLEALGERGEVSLKQIEKAANDASPGMLRLASVTDGVSRSMGGFGAALISPTAAVSALTTAAVGAGIAIAKVGDEMVQTQARLTAATGSAEAAGRVLADLTKLGQQTGVSVSESAGAFARFAIAAREVGATNTQLVALVRTVQQAGIIAGASTQETTATVLQLGQALASGRLQGDELRSIMESMPNLAEALARALNVSVGRLREMGSEGKLTAEVVMNGLGRAGEQINAQFERMPVTMSRAFDILGVSMTGFIGRLDQALGISQAIARAVQAAAAAVNGATAAITPLTPTQSVDADISASDARLAEIRAEMARLTGTAVGPSAIRRGTISRTMQETAAQAAGPDTRLADLQARLDAETRVMAQALERRNAIARQEQDQAEAEEATANARRTAAARAASTTAFNTTRDSLDRERKLREDHRLAIEVIDRGLIVGATNQAEATRLRDLANRQLEDGLKRLTGTQGRNNEAQREANDLAREYNTLRRDTSGVLTMNEADTRMAREITQQIRGTQADPAVRRREAAKEQEDARRDAERTANSIETAFAGAFTRAFESGADAGRSFLESIERGVKSLAATIASQLVFRMAVVPVVNSVGSSLGFGSNLLGMPSSPIGGLNFGGLFGGGSPVASAAGSASAAMQRGQQTVGLTGAGRITGLSGIMSYGGVSNTGWAGVDGFLNTTFSGQPSLAANIGAQTYNGLPVVDSISGSAATYGNVLGGGAAMLGGAYGIYSGIQKGGIGGAVGAVGGAAGMFGGAATMGLLGPALGALGPAGMIAAAVLSIAGALLPGQKPSGRGQEFRYDLGSGDVERNGLGGNRYSAENASQAELATRGIVDLANRLGQRLGGVRNDGQVAVGVTSSRGNGPGTLYLEVNNQRAQFANDEDGAKQLADRAAELLIGQLRDRAQGDYRSILNASGNSVEKLDENLTWYETTYKSLTGAADATSAFATQLKGLTDQWQASIDKANELGLATWRLNERRDEEIAKLYAQRDLQVRSFDLGLDLRAAQAAGSANAMAGAGTAQQVALLQFDLQAAQQIAQARETLEGLGLTSDEVTRRIARNEQVLGQERLAIIEQVAAAQRQLYEGAVSADQDWVIRAKRSEGDGLGADLIDFDRQSRVAVEQSKAAWQAAGMTAEDIAARMVWIEQALARERLAIVEQYAEKARAAEEQARAAEQSAAGSALSVVTSMRDYVRSLSTSDAAAGTVMDRYAAANDNFGEIYRLASGGDAASIAGLQGAAETYRALAREIYGGGQGYADAIQLIGDRLDGISGMGADALTQSFVRENARENTDRIVDALADLRRENASLRRDINMLMMRPAAA
ncbi:tape measure protein [Roseococcus pinisoli]|uniref:Tape measure protein n=1 Tax=Roseococcus pinisoli TaxID=2835040 RepID=A0ABS5QA02_9PROT|nr:tape measure protein [Roseococcus pinisoli]MBS7810539.1 tape measure protein [Roseococcus pinisoli]